MITASTPLNQLFDEACLSAHTIVQAGEIFIVRDLFRGIEWSRIERADRTRLGSMFYAYVLGAGKNDFEPLDKTAQHQQRYRLREHSLSSESKSTMESN